jgi:hypothetical protein
LNMRENWTQAQAEPEEEQRKVLATGTVLEPLPGTQFLVEPDNWHQVRAYLSGKRQQHYVRILLRTAWMWSYRRTTWSEGELSAATGVSACLPSEQDANLAYQLQRQPSPPSAAGTPAVPEARSRNRSLIPCTGVGGQCGAEAAFPAVQPRDWMRVLPTDEPRDRQSAPRPCVPPKEAGIACGCPVDRGESYAEDCRCRFTSGQAR